MNLLPCDEQAEKAILGAFFLRPVEIGGMCATALEIKCFHSPQHQAIYAGLLEMWQAGKQIDLITTIDHLKTTQRLESAGGPGYVCEVSGSIPTAANTQNYIDIVLEKWRLRELASVCRKTQSSLDQATSEELVGEIQKGIGELAVNRKELKTNKEIAFEILEELSDRFENRKAPKDVLTTGLPAVDGALGGGMRPDDYILITGPTKGGKSVLAQNILEWVSIEQKRPSLIFTLEMGVKSYVYRILASTGRVSFTRIRNGWFNEYDPQKIQRAGVKFAESKLMVRDDVRTLAGVVSVSRQTKARFPDLGCIVVDYLQILSHPMQKGGTRELAVAEMSRTIRQLGLELGVPTIVLSQENSTGDARESRSLEQDCTIRFKIEHVPCVDGKGKPTGENEKGMRSIVVPYGRNCPPCEFKLAFLGDFLRFETCTEQPD